MSDVIFDISVSLDGYVAAPNDRPGEELGDGGQRLHTWVFGGGDERDREVLSETWDLAGAVICGARTFDISLDTWGGTPPSEVPWFVLSHDRPDRIAREASGFTFATDGVDDAVARAKAAARGRHVVVMGGAHAGRACMKAGLVDQVQLHVVPVLLGAGIRLFDGLNGAAVRLEADRVIQTPAATHLRYRVA